MVIDPGDNLDLGAAGQEGTGGHVQLPQLHRSAAFPAAVVLTPSPPGLRLDQPVADQGAVNGGAGHLVAAAPHLEHQPARPPLGMAAPQLAHELLDPGGNAPGMVMHPVAAVSRPAMPSCR